MGGVVLAGGASAAAGPSFTATAAANGTRTSVVIPNGPVTDSPVDGGGPTAQAQLDSVGGSKAFAALPYPGDTAVTLPGTLAGLGVPGVPSYPFYVQSAVGVTPKADVSQSGYQLHAASDGQKSESAATFGEASNGASAGSQSTASAKLADDGSVTATAAAATNGAAVSALKLGSVVSTATVRLKPDGSLQRSSSLAVTGLSVGGVAVGFGPSGFTLAGTTVPFPNADQLTGLLSAQHTTLTYVQPASTKSGVVAPALKITTVQTVPGQNPATITLTMGGATASIDGVTAAPPTLELPGVALPSAVGGSSDLGTFVPGSPGTPAIPGTSGTAATPLARAPLRSPSLARAARQRPIDHLGGSTIYLAVAGGGLLALGLASAVSQLGVKLRWSS
jgi:hypothetical protein